MRLVLGHLGVVAALLFALTPSVARGEILPSGTYRYQTTLGGKPVGSSTIVVSRRAGTIEVDESGETIGRGLVSHRTLAESTFATLSYAADASEKHVVVSFTGNEAALTVDGQSVKIAAPAGAPFFVNDNMAAGIALLPATLHASGASQLTMACVCGEFLALPVTTAKQVPARPAGVSDRDQVVAVTMQGQTGTLWFQPDSFVVDRFDLPSQELSMTLQSYDAAIAPLPKPTLPAPLPLPSPHYTASDASIRTADGVTLRGTLTVPDAAATPMPGFVFVHGSGCLDRDETIGPNKIFAQLANRLSNDGYAVLRYDKRSCGRSGGTFPTRNRLIADARDAIAYLRSRPGIDRGRIYVLGHSEGGELAPSIAIADGHLRGIVLLAPPALPLEQILVQQLLRNVPPSERAAREKELRAHMDAIASGKKGGPEIQWLRSTFGIDPAVLIARVPCPILILQGTKDIQVLPSDTPRLVGAARSAHRDVSVVMLQDDDHLFLKLSPTESSTGGEYFTPSYLDPALFAAIEAWLQAHQ